MPLFLPYEDAARLGVARPSQELLVFDKVHCVVSNGVTPAARGARLVEEVWRAVGGEAGPP